MRCPKCGIDNFELPGPCFRCRFAGDTLLLERWLGINYLLSEAAEWLDIPSIYRKRLESKYGKRRRDVEIQLGLRLPPLNREAAELARQELTNIRSFQYSDLAKWQQRGWLTAVSAEQLRQETNERIEQLQARLVDAPPAESERPYSYDKARHRQLTYQLELLEVLNRKNRLADESVYEWAKPTLTADLHQVEIKLGLRQPPRQVVAALEPAPAIPIPAQPPPPPRKPPVATKTEPPPRQPLTWDRVWETLLSERTLRAILFLGATLLFAAAVSLVVWNWGTFPPWLQVTFLASFTAVFYGLGWYVRNRMRLRASGIALTGVASLIVPLDFYAFYLSGGFLELLWSDVWLLTSAVCLAAYLLTVYLVQAEFFGYLVGLAAGSLLAAWLRFVGLETVWWPVLLSGLALVLALTAVMLKKLPVKALRRWQVLKTPFWHLSVLGATAILALSSGRGLAGLDGGDNFLTALAFSWWLGGGIYLLAAGRFKMRPVAMAAAVSFPIAVLLTQQRLYSAWEISAAWYALGWALLTPVYLVAGRRLLAEARVDLDQQRAELFKAYGRTAMVGCILLIILAFGWASADAGAMALVHLILALVLMLAARLWERPNYLSLSSLLLMSSTAGLVSTTGGTISQLGLGWALLAVAHIAAALRLSPSPAWKRKKGEPETQSHPYTVPLFRAGWAIAALATLQPILTFERSIFTYTLANWIAINGWLAMLLHEERLLLDQFWPSVRGRQLRLPKLTFHWMAAMLLPFWLWLAWTNGRSVTATLGIAFLILAWMTLVLGGRLRRVRWDYGRPWFVSAQLSAAIGVVTATYGFDQPAVSILFLTAAAFYTLSTRILHNRWWLVAAGFSLSIGIGFTLDWLNVPLDPLMLALALVTLAFAAGPLLLHRYQGLSLRYQEPLRIVTYVNGALLVFFSILRVLTAERTDALLLWMAATQGVLALTAAVFAWEEKEEGFAHVAAWLSVISGGLIAGAFSQGRGSSAAKAAVLAILYIVVERLLHRASLKWGWRWRKLTGDLWQLFRRPLMTAGWGVSFITIILALFRNMLFLGGGPVRETWAIIGLLLIVGLYLVSAHLYRHNARLSGRRLWWAAALVFFPWTLLTHMGWYLWDAPEPPSRYAVSWLLLALGLLGIATLLTAPAVDRRWTRPPKVIAHLLIPFALVWGIGNSATSSVTFGLAVVFYLLAVFSDRLTQLREDHLLNLSVPSIPRNRFLYPAAFLVPAWGAYLLDYFAPGSSGSTYGILMFGFSLLFFVAGRWVEKREPNFGLPLYIVTYGTAVIGTWLAAPNQPILIGALLFDAFLGVISARSFKQPLWLYLTVATLPAAVTLTLNEWAIPANRFGWGLLGTAQGFLIISWWLSNWNRTEKDKLVQKIAPAAQPFLLGTFWLLLMAVPLTSQDRIGVQLGYCAAAFLSVQLAVWLRQPLLSAVSAALLTGPYIVTIANIGLAYEDYGLALWPLIAVYLLVGYLLDKFVGVKLPGTNEKGEDEFRVLQPFPWESPEWWPYVTLGRLLHWWAFPFYAVAFCGVGIAALLSLADPARLTTSLLLAAAAFGWATYYFRLRGWLLAAITAVQLAVLSGYWWLDWWERPSQVAFIFLPVTCLTALIGMLVERRIRGKEGEGVDWSRPFFMILAADILISQLISINFGAVFVGDVESVWITLGHTLLIAVLAVWWGTELLAVFATLLGFVALVQFLFVEYVSATGWPVALAYLALGYGLAAYGLRFLRRQGTDWVGRPGVRIWERPLLMGGWSISGLSLLGTVFLGMSIVPMLFRAVFRLPLLTPGDESVVQMVVGVLSLLGLLFLAAAVVDRLPRLGYSAMGMLLGAWSLEWALVWGQREVQYYAIPAGVYLLMVGYLEWQRGSRALARWIDYSALVLLLGTSFWQSLGPVGWSYALLMGLEGLLITWWGSTRRLRRFLYAGVVGVTVDVTGQLIQPLLTATNRWIVFGIVGIFLVSLAILVERRLENVLALTKDVRRRLEDWE